MTVNIDSDGTGKARDTALQPSARLAQVDLPLPSSDKSEDDHLHRLKSAALRIEETDPGSSGYSSSSSSRDSPTHEEIIVDPERSATASQGSAELCSPKSKFAAQNGAQSGHKMAEDRPDASAKHERAEPQSRRTVRSATWQVTSTFKWGKPTQKAVDRLQQEGDESNSLNLALDRLRKLQYRPDEVPQSSQERTGSIVQQVEQRQRMLPSFVAATKDFIRSNLRRPRCQWRQSQIDSSVTPEVHSGADENLSMAGQLSPELYFETDGSVNVARFASVLRHPVRQINPFLSAFSLRRDQSDEGPSREFGHQKASFFVDPHLQHEFDFHCQLGIGAFGSVFLVTAKDRDDETLFSSKLPKCGNSRRGGPLLSNVLERGQYYALKAVPKRRMLQHISEFQHAMTEAAVLQRVRSSHPFLLDLVCSFQTRTHAIHVTEFLVGGELFERLKHGPDPMRVDDVRFYMAQIYLALRHLHKIGVIYRDLKPENVMIADDGYIKLIDFGLCKVGHYVSEGGIASGTFCGTREYMSPEVALRKPYGAEVDWWAFGVMIYDLMYGSYPYKIPDFNTDIFFPPRFNEHAKLIIMGLLIPRREHRLGGKMLGGETSIQRHPFFRRLDFDAIYNKKVKAPFVPKLQSQSADFSTKRPPLYFDRVFTTVPFDLPDAGANVAKTDMTASDDFYYLEDFDFASPDVKFII